MVQSLGDIDVKPRVGKLQHDLRQQLLLLALELVSTDVSTDLLIHCIPSLHRCGMLLEFLANINAQLLIGNECQHLE